jgi:small subunit ribosomal protein S6
MLILRPQIASDETQSIGERVSQWIADDGGEVTSMEVLGRRLLAYKIEDHREGDYHLIYFQAMASVLPPLERRMKLDDSIIRYQIIGDARR